MATQSFETIGIIGTGLLGFAMSSRWLAAGRTLVAYDINPANLTRVAQIGAATVDSARTLAETVRTLVLCLPDAQVVSQVVAEMETSLLSGQTIIDTTTGGPDVAQRMAQRLGEKNIAWLDASVAGSSQQVAVGQAVMLVGGDRDVFRRHRGLLSELTPKLFWLGQAGSGAKMKLVVNLAIGLHRAVLAEALTLADTLGLDLEQTLDVLRSTPAYSRAMDAKGHKMIVGDFAPQARLLQHLKDVRLMLQLGKRHGQPLPLTELHESILQSCVDRGDGDLDNSAIIKFFGDARVVEDTDD